MPKSTSSKELETLRDELKIEREKVSELKNKLEKAEDELVIRDRQLAECHRVMKEGLGAEDLIGFMGQQEIKVIAYNLARETQKRMQLDQEVNKLREEIKEKEQKLQAVRNQLEDNNKLLSEIEGELDNERKMRLEAEEKLMSYERTLELKEALGEGYDIDKLMGEVDVSVWKKPKHVVSLQRKKIIQKEKYNDIKELAKLVARLGRIKMVDASILLNTDVKTIRKLATPLMKGGYIDIENPRSKDSTLVITKKLLKLRTQKPKD